MSRRLFVPVNYKTGVVGLWKDAGGKVYRDNIQIDNFLSIRVYEFKHSVKMLLHYAGELCVFYKNYYNEGIIQNRKGEKTIFKNRIALIESKLSAQYIKELLRQHDGLTIYRLKDNKYLIEIYKG